MNQKIIKLAKKKSEELINRYNGFINIGLDNWRGFSLIYDTIDVRRCCNRCRSCFLYKLLRTEQKGFLTAGLKKASRRDKKLFGPQNFLNCKTMTQYIDCYVNFIIMNNLSPDEIKDELKLVINFRIIYSRSGDSEAKTMKFKKRLISLLIKKAKGNKLSLIKRAIKNLKYGLVR